MEITKYPSQRRPQKFYRLVLCPTLTIFKMTVVSRRLASSTEVEFRINTKTRAFIKMSRNVEAGTYMVKVGQAPQGRHIKNVRVAAGLSHQENLLLVFNSTD